MTSALAGRGNNVRRSYPILPARTGNGTGNFLKNCFCVETGRGLFSRGPSHAGGTSRPSSNWSGSSASNRRHLLLIARLALDGERNVLVGQRLQGRFGDDVLPGAEHATRKTAEQEGQRSLLR